MALGPSQSGFDGVEGAICEVSRVNLTVGHQPSAVELVDLCMRGLHWGERALSHSPFPPTRICSAGCFQLVLIWALSVFLRELMVESCDTTPESGVVRVIVLRCHNLLAV